MALLVFSFRWSSWTPTVYYTQLLLSAFTCLPQSGSNSRLWKAFIVGRVGFLASTKLYTQTFVSSSFLFYLPNLQRLSRPIRRQTRTSYVFVSSFPSPILTHLPKEWSTLCGPDSDISKARYHCPRRPCASKRCQPRYVVRRRYVGTS